MNKKLTKILAYVGVLALAGGAVIGGLQLWGKGNLKPSNWGTHAPAEDNGDDGTLVITPDFFNTEIELDVAQYSLNGDLIENTYEDEEGHEITSYSSTSRTCVITAVAKNADGSVDPALQSFAWELSDETAGVNMTVDGATATLECTKIFTEQLTLTVTSTLDGTKFTTVKIDYLKSIQSVRYDLQGRNSYSSAVTNELYINIPYYGFEKTYASLAGNSGYREQNICFYKSASVSAGTLEDEILSYKVNVNLSEEAKARALEKVNANSQVGVKRTINDFKIYSPIDSESYAPNKKAGDMITTRDFLSTSALFNWNSNTTTEGQGVFASYVSAFYGLENQLEVSVVFNTKYQGEVIINYTVTVNVTGYEVQSVETDHSDGVLFM